MRKTVSPPAAKRRRQRRLSFDRERALEQALQLFWRRGYEGTSVADLIAAMGISPPSLYTAFGSKEGLYREALERYGTTHGAFLLAALEEEPTAFLAVQRLLAEAARFYADPAIPGGCMVATATQHCHPEHADMARLLAGKRSAIIAAIEDRIRRGVDEGDLPAQADAPALARYVAAVMQGLSVQARDGGLDPATLERVVELALRAWPALVGHH